MSRDDDEARLEAQRLWGTPSPDAPGQGEAGAGGEVEALAESIAGCRMTAYDDGTGGYLWRSSSTEEIAAAVLASDWLAAHDASVVAAARADAEARLTAVRAWIVNASNALQAASEIGKRSCRDGDHLNYGNHDGLIREARDILAPPAEAAQEVER